MSGLALKLAPRERLLINGAVIENGERRSRFTILSPDTKLLRLKDAIHPEQANTPVSRLCYASQLVLSGDADAAITREKLMHGIDALMNIFYDDQSRSVLSSARSAAIRDDFYRCFKALKTLQPLEMEMIKGS